MPAATTVEEVKELDPEEGMFVTLEPVKAIEKVESETKEEKLEIKDTLIVFVKDELVFFRFNKMTGWNVGDSNFEFPRFSSFARIPDEMDHLNIVDGFVTGGSMMGFG